VPVVFLIGLIADYFHLPPAMNGLALLVLVGGFATIWYGRKSPHRPLVVTRAPSRADVAPASTRFAAADPHATDGLGPRRDQPRRDQPRSRPREPQLAEPFD
jgi:hypothetical protein